MKHTVLPRKRMPSSESRTEPYIQSAYPALTQLRIVAAATNLPDERLDAASTTIDLVEGDLTDNLVAVVPAMVVSSAGGKGGRRAAAQPTCGAS